MLLAGFPGLRQDWLDMEKRGFAGRLATLVGRFRRDSSGNIAVIFVIALLPILAGIGCATDYSMATRIKSKMQSAADAASVASLSQQSPGFIAAAAMTTDGSVTAAVTDANNVFNGNMNGVTGFTGLTETATVTKTGARLVSQVTFSANVPTVFMNALGWTNMTVSGSSSSSAALPLYLDFYLALDVSGSMGLPSTSAEAVRMQQVNPDNFVQYPTGCTLACHFAPQRSACVDPPVTAPAAPPLNPPTTTTSYTQQYNTNGYCMGYVYSRLNQPALKTLISSASTVSRPKQVPGLPVAMLSGLTTSITGPNSLLTGNTSSLPYSLTPTAFCPTQGADACIQLRLDAVGVALNSTQATNGLDGLFATALNPKYATVTNQFRIGLYPFITDIDKNYAPLTTTFTAGSTIRTAAQNLATELDTNMDSVLGSGGTHIDYALHSLNTLIATVGTGTSPTNTLPYIFLVTDGAQDNQYKDVPNGSWHGSNHATVLNDSTTVTYASICTTLKNRGIMISVLYIPYQTISPVNTTFAGNEDTYANNNIGTITPPTGIAASLKACASPDDSAGSYFYPANTPDDITKALAAMFNHAVRVAHITN
jgi:Flp pilus assembly protein TadG